jgi:hypothetical protein
MNTKVCEALDLPNWAKATAQEYLSGYEDQTNDNYIYIFSLIRYSIYDGTALEQMNPR